MIIKSLLLAALSLSAQAHPLDEQTGPAIREARVHGILYKFDKEAHDKVCEFSGTAPVFDWRQSQDVAIRVVGECASTLGGQAVTVQITAQLLIVAKEGEGTYKSAYAAVQAFDPAAPKVNLQAYSAAAGTTDLGAKQLFVSVNPTQAANQEMFHAAVFVDDAI
jgi:hypothetical protein